MLTNTSASAGSNITFTCSAFAVPEAMISWSHTSLSGVERNLTARTNVQITGNTIKIFNVEYFRDGGKYTCTAINRHGSIKTDAHLNLDCECDIYIRHKGFLFLCHYIYRYVCIYKSKEIKVMVLQ